MATWYCLALIRPFDPVSGERVDVRVCNAQSRHVSGLGGYKWAIAMTKAPVIAMQFFEGDFSTPVSVDSAGFDVSLERLTEAQQFANADRYFWQGADVTLYLGRAGDIWPWKAYFRGQVTDHKGQGRTLSLTASVNDDRFAREVLTATYAGTGGVEGGEDIKGQVKPLALGWPQNVEPVLINAVDSIYQFSAYGPIEAVTVLYERGSSFGPAAGDHASYSALQAADIAPGAWATCLAEGLVRLGGPAYSVITGDIKGHAVSGTAPRLTGELIALLASIAEIGSGDLITASLHAMDADCPYPVDIVLTQQARFDDLARQMVLPCNYQAGIWRTGEFYVTAPDLDEQEALVLHAQGKRMPQVAETSEERVSRPYWRIVLGAERSWRVHAPNEIATGGYTLRGEYEATTVYREDDLVFSADGRSFVYINETPGAGNSPPDPPATGNAWWQQIGAADNTENSQVRFGAIPKIDVTASSGNVTTTDLSAMPRRVILLKGETDVSASATFTAGAAPGGLAGGFGAGADHNLFTLSQADASGSFPVSAIYNGITYTTFIEVTRTKAAAEVPGGTGNAGNVSDSSWTYVSGATYETVTDPNLIIQSDGSGELVVALSAQISGQIDVKVDVSVDYSTDGSTWTSAYSVTSTPVQQGAPGYVVSGYLGDQRTLSGLAATTDYYWRLQARRVAGAGSANFSSEYFEVSQP